MCFLFFNFLFSYNTLCSSALIFHLYHENFRCRNWDKAPVSGLCWPLPSSSSLCFPITNIEARRNQVCLDPPLVSGTSLGLAALLSRKTPSRWTLHAGSKAGKSCLHGLSWVPVAWLGPSLATLKHLENNILLWWKDGKKFKDRNLLLLFRIC